ncbi:Zinc finger and SCAN domain-containing protein 12 [Merluccius polli]|uniref:Zinc finger and SCAN domain-containing protein 12 n=1 Tax=Merluccius polli TaxID=89951 RepID=A0AA47M2J7_MERPO|nr:Zinc finger and SCAN domain-containing protein 12 [Merluccius polli]
MVRMILMACRGATGGQSQDPQCISELSSLLRGLMEQQSDREGRWEQDQRCQEGRWKRVQHQFSLLQQEVRQEHDHHNPVEGVATDAVPLSASSSVHSEAQIVQRPVPDPLDTTSGQPLKPGQRFPGWTCPKMQPYREDKDIEHYLTTIEIIALACQWPREDWALHLAPLLTGKARAAYVAMDIEETMEYVKVKNAVLQKYQINAESYRVRFQFSKVEDEETPKELQARLRDLYDKWMNPKVKSKEQIGDAIIMEQFLRILNPELHTWVKERNPATSKEAAEMAETFLAARRTSKAFSSPNPRPHTAASVFGNFHKHPLAFLHFSSSMVIQYRVHWMFLRKHGRSHSHSSNSSAVPCHMSMRDKLSEYQELANSNLASAQQRQKVGYDKSSQRRFLQQGQKVLLLLPTSESGHLAGSI